MTRRRLFLILLLIVPALGAAAPARLHLGETTILGNGELPKVTFVVPWGDAAAPVPDWAPHPTARPPAVPLDQESYRRRLHYLKQQQGSKADKKP